MLKVFEGRLESDGSGEREEVVGIIRSLDVGSGGWLMCESFGLDGFLNFRLDIHAGREFPTPEAALIRVDRLDVLDNGGVYLIHFSIESRP